jgi:TRAP-type mannitol/chloroaromatic compound transport system permease small subunit
MNQLQKIMASRHSFHRQAKAALAAILIFRAVFVLGFSLATLEACGTISVDQIYNDYCAGRNAVFDFLAAP